MFSSLEPAATSANLASFERREISLRLSNMLSKVFASFCVNAGNRIKSMDAIQHCRHQFCEQGGQIDGFETLELVKDLLAGPGKGKSLCS